jgi:hypothetical protein
MADIGEGMRAKLLATNAVTAILGTRIYPDRLPQRPTMPAAIYWVVSGVDEAGLGGLLGVAHARVQVDAYATTRLGANALATAIRDALAATGGRGTWGAVDVSGCTPQGGERYDTQPLGDGSDDPQYITSRDYLISFAG